jgi:hypothetical protein
VDQFSRVLTLLGLLPPPQFFDLLVRKYIDNGNPKEVNYVKFCSDVDNVAEMLETVIKGIKPNEKIVLGNEVSCLIFLFNKETSYFKQSTFFN